MVNRNIKIKLFGVGSDLRFNVMLKTDQMNFSPRVGSTERARGVGVHFLPSSGPQNKEIKHEPFPQEQDNDEGMEKEGGGGMVQQVTFFLICHILYNGPFDLPEIKCVIY